MRTGREYLFSLKYAEGVR